MWGGAAKAAPPVAMVASVSAVAAAKERRFKCFLPCCYPGNPGGARVDAISIHHKSRDQVGFGLIKFASRYQCAGRYHALRHN